MLAQHVLPKLQRCFQTSNILSKSVQAWSATKTRIHSKINRRALSTTSDTTSTTAPDSNLVMNRLGLEQKTIVAQEMPVTSYCRCWLSKTFPMCDGSHKAHNALTGMHNHSQNFLHPFTNASPKASY